MKQLSVIKHGPVSLSLNAFKGMPKQSKTPEGYSLKVGGKEIKHPDVQLTGGGAFPQYSYVNLEGQTYWFAGQFAAGTEVEVVAPVETPAAVAAPVKQDPDATVPLGKPNKGMKKQK